MAELFKSIYSIVSGEHLEKTGIRDITFQTAWWNWTNKWACIDSFDPLPTPTAVLTANGAYSITNHAIIINTTYASPNSLHFPIGAIPKQIYLACPIQGTRITSVGVSDGTIDNWYRLTLNPGATAADFSLQKKVAGTTTDLATEAVDIDQNAIVFVEMFFLQEYGRILVWRDGSIKFQVTDTELKTLDHLMLHQYGLATHSMFYSPFIFAWEV